MGKKALKCINCWQQSSLNRQKTRCKLGSGNDFADVNKLAKYFLENQLQVLEVQNGTEYAYILKYDWITVKETMDLVRKIVLQVL